MRTAATTRIYALICCAVAMAMAACQHKDLCYDHSHNVEIEIKFNWENAPDAAPRTMVVNFFSLDGKHFARREFSSRDGGSVKIEAGEYRVLCHNGEMDNVNEAIGNYDEYSLTTVNESLLAPLSRDMPEPPRPTTSSQEAVKASAETVWADKKEYVMIVPQKDGQVIEFSPLEATAHYFVEIINVENMRDNLNISAALSGLSERFNICHSSAVGQPVTMPFSVTRKDNRTLQAAFLTFGHCPENNEVQHILSIYTSSKTYYDFDVTRQVHDAPDDKNIYILIDGLSLPTGGQDV